MRELKRPRGGSVTKIHENYGVRATSESGYSHILCGECEKYFNNACDEYSIKAVNSLSDQKKSAEVDHNILSFFICSVLWRANISTAAMYSGYKVTELDKKLFSNVIFKRKGPFEDFSFEVAHLYDQGGNLNADHIKKSISSTYRGETKIGSKTHIIHHFSIKGVFLSALHPPVPVLIQDQRYLRKGG